MMVLESWLRQRTTAPLHWLTERLAWEHFKRVSQAIGRMKCRPGRKLEQLKRKLIELGCGQK